MSLAGVAESLSEKLENPRKSVNTAVIDFWSPPSFGPPGSVTISSMTSPDKEVLKAFLRKLFSCSDPKNRTSLPGVQVRGPQVVGGSDGLFEDEMPVLKGGEKVGKRLGKFPFQILMEVGRLPRGETD